MLLRLLATTAARNGWRVGFRVDRFVRCTRRRRAGMGLDTQMEGRIAWPT